MESRMLTADEASIISTDLDFQCAALRRGAFLDQHDPRLVVDHCLRYSSIHKRIAVCCLVPV